MKILISAGGTGGHIYPALAIIEGFKKYDKNLEVLYIGTKNRTYYVFARDNAGNVSDAYKFS